MASVVRRVAEHRGHDGTMLVDLTYDDRTMDVRGVRIVNSRTGTPVRFMARTTTGTWVTYVVERGVSQSFTPARGTLVLTQAANGDPIYPLFNVGPVV